MSIRKRKWNGPDGEAKFAWVVDFKDLGGTRRLRTFRLKKEADRFTTKVRAELLDAELKAKGPAEAATSPSHGSTNPGKDTVMNEAMNTTSEHPWEAARRLSKELSATMSLCNAGDWYAHVFPADRPYCIAFAAKPDAGAEVELPVDRINRLAWELSAALDEWQGASFQAMVLPASKGGHTVMFTNIKAWDRRVEA